MPYGFSPKSRQPMPSAWTFQPTFSSQQAWTLKSETHTLLCEGLDAVCCHLGPEPRIRWEKSDRWKKGRGKKNQWVPQLHSWFKKLKVAISFHFKGTLLKPFQVRLTCTGLNKASVCLSQSTDGVPALLIIFPTAFIWGSTFERPTPLWLAWHALLALTSREDIRSLSHGVTHCT